MSIYEVLVFAVFAGLLVISPGPNGLLIAKTVTKGNLKKANANIIGFIAAFYLHGAFSMLGISAILLQSADAFFVFKIVGATYLFYIGVKSLLSALKTSTKDLLEPQMSPENTLNHKVKAGDFLEGFLTNGLNPKVSLFYLAAFPQFIGANDSVVMWSLLLITVHATMNLIWFSFLAQVIHKSKTLPIKRYVKRWLDGMTGFLFIGFAVKLLTTKNAT